MTKTDSPSGYLIEAEVPGDVGRIVVRMVVTVNGDFAIFAISFVAEIVQQLHQPILDRMFSSFGTFAPTAIPVGWWFKGNTTLVRVEEMHRVPEVRYPRAAGQAIMGDTLIIDIEDMQRVPEIRYGRLVGPPVKGDTLIISIEDIQRLQEMRYQDTDGIHYVIAPSSEDNELLAVQVSVQNPEAEAVSLTVVEDTAELRGFGPNEAYMPLGVTSQTERNVTQVDESHPSENLFTPPSGQPDRPTWGPFGDRMGPVRGSQGHPLEGDDVGGRRRRRSHSYREDPLCGDPHERGQRAGGPPA